MAKPSRKARKEYKQKVQRARDQGLPEPEPLEPKRPEVPQGREQRYAADESSAAAAGKNGLPTAVKVAIGVVVALVVVFALSQLRKG